MLPAPRRRIVWTESLRAQFLESLSVLGTIRAAAAEAGVPSRSVLALRKSDPTFAEEIQDALDQHELALMRQVKALALDGLVTSRAYNDSGDVIAEERKYSERILLAFIRRMESGTWAPQKQVEHTHTVRRPALSLDNLTPEQLRAARQLLATLGVPADPPRLTIEEQDPD